MSFCIVLLERIEKHSARKCRNVCLMPCTSIYYLLEFLENLEFCIDMICNLRFQALDVCTSISILCLLSSNDSLSLHFPLVSFALHRFHNNSKILCVCVCVCASWCIDACIWHSCIFDKTISEDALNGPTWFSTQQQCDMCRVFMMALPKKRERALQTAKR